MGATTTIEELKNIIKELGESQRATEASQRETKASQRETEESLRETQESLRETQRTMGKARLETEKSLTELGKSLDKARGNFNNKWGAFMENLVEGDLVRLFTERGIRVDKVISRVKLRRPDGTIRNEYDLVAVDGAEVVVVEVKTTLSMEKLETFIQKLKAFKGRFPEYDDRNVYGAVAYLEAAGDSAETAEREGLFVIKSPGGPTGISIIANAGGFEPKAF